MPSRFAALIPLNPLAASFLVAAVALLLIGGIHFSVWDLITRSVPTEVGVTTVAGLLLLSTSAAVAAVSDPRGSPTLGGAVMGIWVGALGSAAVFGLIHYCFPASLGWGDVQVAPFFGGYLGYVGQSHLLYGALAVAVCGAFTAVVALMRGRQSIPYIPPMFSGTFIALAAPS